MVKRYSSTFTHLRATVLLPYGITHCYLPPDTRERAPPNSGQKGWYSIQLPQRDGRLSWPKWLVIYRDGLPAHRRSRSPIEVLTGQDLE